MTGFAALAGKYRSLLADDILPWWTRHAVDAEFGGILSCIRDDGTVVSTDKYLWSQTRALWTFSAACRRIEPREEWRDIAGGLFRFLMRSGRNEAGDWIFLATREGAPLRGPESIQTDAYAICALVEYARLTGSEEALETALAGFRRTLEKIRQPGSYQTAPYPIPPGTKAQRVSMQLSLSYHDLARLTGRADVLGEAMRLTDEVLDNFRRPEKAALVEYLSLDNQLLPAPVGTYMSPGHGIETAWFQLESLRERGDRGRARKALDIMRWSFEKGWDPEYGGLLLGIDLEGGMPYLPHADTKVWWPFCEALCGALLAFEAEPDPFWLDWYRRTEEWAFAHFPDAAHGEWTQRLDRQGRPIDTVVALPVKDPFHLPRAAIYAYETAVRLAAPRKTVTPRREENHEPVV